MDDQLRSAIGANRSAGVVVLIPQREPRAEADELAAVRAYAAGDGAAHAPASDGALGELFQAFVGARVRSVRRTMRAGGEKPASFSYFPRLGVVCGEADHQGLVQIERNKLTAGVGLMPQFELIGADAGGPPVMGPAGVEPGVCRIGAVDLWVRGLTGAGVFVGHLDAGIEPHAALNEAIGEFAAFDRDGAPILAPKPYGIGGHGTHTAGIICARPFAGTELGVAPGAKLYSALVADSGEPFEKRVLAGMEWMLKLRPRILNMSIGLTKPSGQFDEMVARIRKAGILPIAAIGNDYPAPPRAPGYLAGVVSVGAVNGEGAIWPGSASGAGAGGRNVPDVVAPGVGIRSCAKRDTLVTSSGTSQAAAHISGLAALLAQARPSASAEQLERAIVGSAVRDASLSEERAGQGLPDAMRALQLLTGAKL